jgi:hypothetical protein
MKEPATGTRVGFCINLTPRCTLDRVARIKGKDHMLVRFGNALAVEWSQVLAVNFIQNRGRNETSATLYTPVEPSGAVTISGRDAVNAMKRIEGERESDKASWEKIGLFYFKPEKLLHVSLPNDTDALGKLIFKPSDDRNFTLPMQWALVAEIISTISE